VVLQQTATAALVVLVVQPIPILQGLLLAAVSVVLVVRRLMELLVPVVTAVQQLQFHLALLLL
jgi:hypothetical protein